MYQIKEWLKQMFAYPPLSLSEVDYDEYWKNKRGEKVGALSSWQEERADFIVDSLEGRGRSVFIDIGSGDGSVLNYLKEKDVLESGVGVDTSKFALEQVAKFGFDTMDADITSKEFLSRIPAGDYAIFFEILEHIPHSEVMLNTAYKKMSKGVFFSFPNTGFFVHRFRLLFGKFPLQWMLSPGEHLRYWTKKDLLWWLESLGYKDYRVRYYKGVPVLNKLWPSMFAAGFVVSIPKSS